MEFPLQSHRHALSNLWEALLLSKMNLVNHCQEHGKQCASPYHFISLSPQFPASLHHFSMQSNVSVALLLLCFAGQWPPQQIKRSIEGTLGPSA
jgi:hypothetical protein